ncbi:MAG: NADH:ubiquinone oxidoreductase subunit NDUFA12 [Rickettsiales bacterium]
MTITTRLFTYFNGVLVGEDEFGNRYFTEKKNPKNRKAKRWVIYKGMAEPSKVPPKWFGWLHYTTSKIPLKADGAHYSWEKSHLPNLTGTKHAYFPSGSLRTTSEHASSSDSYEAWIPRE